MSLPEFIQQLNAWGAQKTPFLFLMDFEMQKPIAFRLSDIHPEKILYDFNGATNTSDIPALDKNITLVKHPIGLEEYQAKFTQVLQRLEYGDSYLTNLTIKTRLHVNLSLHDLFFLSKARYRLLYKNDFLVFSPEIFIQIRNGNIFSFPMKGTIDAAMPSAEEKIKNDVKELAEHVTIVDLIRNDLSLISKNVRVTRFRYIEELKTNDKTLLQVSSEIVGDLDDDYNAKLGDIVASILPAGSITGAPKPKTIEIIRQAENEKRGYYTGVFGLFDGENFDSGVMIRFIEQSNGLYYYRSGGGITTQSILEKEYQEAIDKVYVPVN